MLSFLSCSLCVLKYKYTISSSCSLDLNLFCYLMCFILTLISVAFSNIYCQVSLQLYIITNFNYDWIFACSIYFGLLTASIQPLQLVSITNTPSLHTCQVGSKQLQPLPGFGEPTFRYHAVLLTVTVFVQRYSMKSAQF